MTNRELAAKCLIEAAELLSEAYADADERFDKLNKLTDKYIDNISNAIAYDTSDSLLIDNLLATSRNVTKNSAAILPSNVNKMRDIMEERLNNNRYKKQILTKFDSIKEDLMKKSYK